ncbi:AAA family ATPase [Vibrio sp. SCSIO 43155]|uniref:AAA family ATPase n=1 Tax=Vibrio TaxID=662 RepID=UPI0020765738|nr:AAA family ATPase [Vibrio sp. SCSIO 43155]USD58557.1 AAA family ATPase [Vibrio sp. SCSIO 43155]
MRTIDTLSERADRALSAMTFNADIEASVPTTYTPSRSGGWAFTKNSLQTLPGLKKPLIEQAMRELEGEGYVFESKTTGSVKSTHLSIDDACAIYKKLGFKTFKERFNNRCLVVSFANLKGGATKSSSTVTVAHALRTHKRRIADDLKILVVDLDPQSSATMFLNRSLAVGDVQCTAVQAMLNDLTTEDLLEHFCQPSQISGVDVIPSSIDDGFIASRLYDLWRDDEDLKHMNPLLLLKLNLIDKLSDHYDIIFLDTGPHIDPLLENTLCAVDALFTPCPPAQVDLHSTLKYVKQLPTLRENINKRQPEDLISENLVQIGYMTKFDENKRDHDEAHSLAKSVFGSQNFLPKALPKLDGFERCGENFETVIAASAKTYEGDSSALNSAKTAAYEFADSFFEMLVDKIEDGEL